jgi:hypothetical protein
MKKARRFSNESRHKKLACTVSAAALMLGVSSAATVGLHFQESYCDGNGLPLAGYSGIPVTLTAFGIAPSSWENLTMMPTGYSGCKGPLGYTFTNTITTAPATNGLNPLPNGSLTVTWFGPTANFSGFGGYAGNPPHYTYGGTFPNTATPLTGEEQIYAVFLRDGLNFGPDSSSGDNNQPGYSVDVTGLKSVFTNSPFVVELMASSDSMEVLTNAFVIDVANSKTNSVTYPNTPPVANDGDTAWVRGSGGGLSTASGVVSNTDHIKIVSAQPAHVGGQFNHAGTISGFILTDKPVVTMSPRSVLAGPKDSVALSFYAIGVPPLSYQWRKNGTPVSGATNTSFSVASVTSLTNGGNYDVVVTNLYGAATSAVATVTVDSLTKTSASQIVFDSNPANFQKDGVNSGAAWLASNSDGTVTRTGLMQFNGSQTNGITVPAFTSFDSTNGTFSFWMRSAGTVTTNTGGVGAPLFGFPTGTALSDFMLFQIDGVGDLQFQSPGGTPANSFDTIKTVSDNKWHFVTVTYDQSASGGAAVFVDGVLDLTNSNGGTAWATPAAEPLQIGFSTDPTFRAYNGLLDDFRFYNRVLTASEITSVYQSNAIVDANALQLEFNFTSAPGTGVVLNWQEGTAVLQSAPNVNGPYTDVQGVTSPYTVVPSANQQFFRYRYVPQAVVSNPYLM